MSYWELRQWIEQGIPWWAPIAMVAIVAVAHAAWRVFDEWRRA